MSDVYFHFESDSASGFAVGEVWRAFASSAFERQSFTAYYGPNSKAVELTMPGGQYWVQLKLPQGEFTRDFVLVPEQKEAVTIVLQIPDTAKLASSSLSILPYFERTARQVVDTIVRLPPPGNALIVLDGNRRTRSVRPAVPARLPPLFALDSWPNLSTRISDVEPAVTMSPAHFSLGRIYGKFIKWPRRSFSKASRAAPAFIQPEEFFRSALRAPIAQPMAARVDGDSLVSEITTLGEFVAPRNKQDIAARRFTRDLVVVRGVGNKIQMLAVVPNGWNNGGSARVRITRDGSNESFPLRVSVEVQEPRFNALLDFIKSGDLNAAVRVIESSAALLYAKFDNPYAAAAAGYVLVQAAPQTMRMPWQYWIGNLGRYFSDLPDGEILHATLLLQRGDVEDWGTDYEEQARCFPEGQAARNKLAAQLILSALGKGPPMFRTGLSLLASNLQILNSVDLPEDIRSLLKECEKLVTWLSMRVDPIEPFCIFRLRS